MTVIKYNETNRNNCVACFSSLHHHFLNSYFIIIILCWLCALMTTTIMSNVSAARKRFQNSSPESDFQFMCIIAVAWERNDQFMCERVRALARAYTRLYTQSPVLTWFSNHYSQFTRSSRISGNQSATALCGQSDSLSQFYHLHNADYYYYYNVCSLWSLVSGSVYCVFSCAFVSKFSSVSLSADINHLDCNCYVQNVLSHTHTHITDTQREFSLSFDALTSAECNAKRKNAIGRKLCAGRRKWPERN